MNSVVKAIKEYPGSLEQVPCWIPELRKLAGMPKPEFDAAVLEMMRGGLIWLDKHCHPAQATTAELESFVIDGDRVYVALLVRRESVKAFTDIQVEQPGKRRRGRPPMPEHLRRVSLGGSVRLPCWMVEWLKTRGDMGTVIEAALKNQYKLQEPWTF